jgi:hypothetical protein
LAHSVGVAPEGDEVEPLELAADGCRWPGVADPDEKEREPAHEDADAFLEALETGRNRRAPWGLAEYNSWRLGSS